MSKGAGSEVFYSLSLQADGICFNPFAMPLVPAMMSRDRIYCSDTCLLSSSLVPSIVLLTGGTAGNKTDGNPRPCVYLLEKDKKASKTKPLLLRG